MLGSVTRLQKLVHGTPHAHLTTHYAQLRLKKQPPLPLPPPPPASTILFIHPLRFKLLMLSHSNKLINVIIEHFLFGSDWRIGMVPFLGGSYLESLPVLPLERKVLEKKLTSIIKAAKPNFSLIFV